MFLCPYVRFARIFALRQEQVVGRRHRKYTCLSRIHKVTQRSGFRTILDNGFASGTSRSLTETWIRQG
jgi:hypothetical protein